MTTTRVALLQHAAPPSEPRASVLRRVEAMAREAKGKGARILCTLSPARRRTGGRNGVASLCIGGGEATAMAIELI